MNIITGVSLDK